MKEATKKGNLRKMLAFALVLVLALCTLVACGSSDSSSDEAETEAAETETEAETEAEEDHDPYKIAFIPIGDSEYFQAWISVFYEECEARGIEGYVTIGDYDAEVQTTAIENYVAMGVDGILLFPVSGSALNSAVDNAMAAGVKMGILVNETDNYDFLMGANPTDLAIGEANVALEWIDQTFPDAEPGSVETAIITFRGTPAATTESDWLEENFEGLDERIKVVTSYDITEESAESGYTAAEDLAVMYPDLNVVVTASGDASIGFNNYYTSLANTRDDISKLGVFGINLTDVGYQAIMASANDEAIYRAAIITGTITRNVPDQLDNMIAAIEGTLPTQSSIGIDVVEVWPDNAEDIMIEDAVSLD